MQIRDLVKRLFTSVEVQHLGDKILKIIKPLVQTDSVIAALYTRLNGAVKMLKAARKNTQLNTHTELLAAADDVRDLAFRAFIQYVEASSIRQNESYSLPAQALLKHIEKFDRRIPYLGYTAQTAELNIFFDEMEKASALVQGCGASEWMSELKTSQEAFLTVQGKQVNEEVEKKLLIPAKQAKAATFELLIGLVNVLNGLALAGVEGIADINMKVDQIIEDVEVPARARRTKKENKAENRQTPTE